MHALLGSSYLPSDILAAFLYAQFGGRETVHANRQAVWNYYEHLREWAVKHRIGLPIVPAHCQQSCHMFYLVLSSLSERQALIAPQSPGDSQRLSLSAPAPFRHGRALWRESRALPGDRGCQ